MCSSGVAVFEADEVTGEAEAAVVTAAVEAGAAALLVATGVSDDSVFKAGGSGSGGGGGGELGGVVPTAVSAAYSWYLGGFLSDWETAGPLGHTGTSVSSG